MAYIILFMLYFQLVFNVNANENKELAPEVGLYKLEAKGGQIQLFIKLFFKRQSDDEELQRKIKLAEQAMASLR